MLVFISWFQAARVETSQSILLDNGMNQDPGSELPLVAKSGDIAPCVDPPALQYLTMSWLGSSETKLPADVFDTPQMRSIGRGQDQDAATPLHLRNFESMFSSPHSGHRRHSKNDALPIQGGAGSDQPISNSTLSSLLCDHRSRSTDAVRYRPLERAVQYRDGQHCGALCKQSADPRLLEVQGLTSPH